MPCQIELGYPSFEPTFVDYFGDGTARLKCSQGHLSTVVIQGQTFQFLLESGANALLDRNTFEACALFSTAWERFLEYYVRVESRGCGISPDEFEAIFKTMSRQSERQVGAFLILHAVARGRAYKPDQKIADFRNKVIHKGEIPNLKQTENFCGKIYQEISALYDEMKQAREHEMDVIDQETNSKRWASVDRSIPTTAHSGSVFFCRWDVQETLEDALSRFQKYRDARDQAVPEMSRLFEALQASIPNKSE